MFAVLCSTDSEHTYRVMDLRRKNYRVRWISVRPLTSVAEIFSQNLSGAGGFRKVDVVALRRV